MSNLTVFANSFVKYCCFSIVPIGVIFNAINVYVFRRKKLNKTTMGFYYTTISAFSILVLIMHFVYFYDHPIGKSISMLTGITCRFILYLTRCCTQITSWIHTLSAFDRMITVMYPNRFNWLKNKTVLAGVVFAISILILSLNIPSALLDLRVTKLNLSIANETIESKSCTSANVILLMGDMVGFLNRTVIPFTFMLIFDMKIVAKLISSKKKLIKNDQMKREYQFAFSVFFLNIVFVIFLLPIGIVLVVRSLIQIKLIFGPSQALISMLFFVTAFFAVLNDTLSIFIHIIFNKLYRKEIMILLGLRTTNRQQSASSSFSFRTK
jgi:hypothetical protein